MIVPTAVVFLLVGVIHATPATQVEDDWKDIVGAGAEVLGNVAKVVVDGVKIFEDIKGKRDTEDDWKDIVGAGAEVLGNLAKVVKDGVAIYEDIKGKRGARDDLTGAILEQELKKIFGDVFKFVNGGLTVREAPGIVGDGAQAVNDLIDLGKSIVHLVNVIGK